MKLLELIGLGLKLYLLGLALASFILLAVYLTSIGRLWHVDAASTQFVPKTIARACQTIETGPFLDGGGTLVFTPENTDLLFSAAAVLRRFEDHFGGEDKQHWWLLYRGLTHEILKQWAAEAPGTEIQLTNKNPAEPDLDILLQAMIIRGQVRLRDKSSKRAIEQICIEDATRENGIGVQKTLSHSSGERIYHIDFWVERMGSS